MQRERQKEQGLPCCLWWLLDALQSEHKIACVYGETLWPLPHSKTSALSMPNPQKSKVIKVAGFLTHSQSEVCERALCDRPWVWHAGEESELQTSFCASSHIQQKERPEYGYLSVLYYPGQRPGSLGQMAIFIFFHMDNKTEQLTKKKKGGGWGGGTTTHTQTDVGYP